MPSFKVVLSLPDGSTKTGTITGESDDGIAKFVEAKGYKLISCTRVDAVKHEMVLTVSPKVNVGGGGRFRNASIIALSACLLLVGGIAVKLSIDTAKQSERILSLEREMIAYQKAKVPNTALIPTPVEKRGELPPKVIASESSPENVLREYLSAKTWPERLALVSEPEKCREIMAQLYDNFEPPASFQIVGTGVVSLSLGESHVFMVNLENHLARYSVIQTNQGPRVDWLTSRIIWQQDEEKILSDRKTALLESLGLVIHDVKVTTLLKEQQYSRAKFTFSVNNLTKANINLLSLHLKAYSKNGEFLGMGNGLITNLKPGATATEYATIDNIDCRNVVKVEYEISSASILTSTGTTMDAASIITLIQ